MSDSEAETVDSNATATTDTEATSDNSGSNKKGSGSGKGSDSGSGKSDLPDVDDLDKKDAGGGGVTFNETVTFNEDTSDWSSESSSRDGVIFVEADRIAMTPETARLIAEPGMSEEKGLCILASVDHELLYMAATFSEIDRDGDGLIELSELARFMARSNTYAVTVMNEFDVNGDGVWTFDEFIGWMESNNRDILESSKLCVCEEIRAMIIAYQNKYGFILTARSLYAFRKVFELFDTNGTGTMDRKEFVIFARKFIKYKTGGTLSQTRINYALRLFLHDAKTSVDLSAIYFRHFLALLAGLSLSCLLGYRSGYIDDFVREVVDEKDINLDSLFIKDLENPRKIIWMLCVAGVDFCKTHAGDLLLEMQHHDILDDDYDLIREAPVNHLNCCRKH